MKKNKKVAALKLIILLTVFLNSVVVAQKSARLQPAKSTYTNLPACFALTATEAGIDLNLHEKPEADGNNEISQFTLASTPASGPPMPFEINKIEKAKLCTLMVATNTIVSQTTNTNIIRAVKIILGMDPLLKKINLIYQPVVLCLTSISGTLATYTVFAGSTPQYFSCTNGNFTAITSLSLASTYSNNISLLQGASTVTFTPGTDVESLIYSFQEIASLIGDNNTDEIRVWNTVITQGNRNYHSILLGPSHLDGPHAFKSFNNFKNKFANLAHLCPPNCVTIQFKLKEMPQ